MEPEWSELTSMIMKRYKQYPLNLFLRKKTHNFILNLTKTMGKLNLLTQLHSLKTEDGIDYDNEETFKLYEKVFKFLGNQYSNEYIWTTQELTKIYNRVVIGENVMNRKIEERDEKHKWEELRYLTYTR